MAQRINKDNFEEKVLKSPLPVLVDFYSDSCIPGEAVITGAWGYRGRTRRHTFCI